MKPIVIYHGGCKDGFCGAWVARKFLGDADFHPGFYGQDPPDVTDRDVFVIDFSYPREMMEKMRVACKSITVLDHHKTAEAALAGFFDLPKVAGLFDMNRSGAGIAWDWFSKGSDRPWMVNYVEDRDLWRHELPSSRIVNAYISTIPFNFKDWDKRMELTHAEAEIIGLGIQAKIDQYVVETAKNSFEVNFLGHKAMLVNATQTDCAELREYIAEKHQCIAINWFQRADGLYQYGLAVRGADIDLSELAKKFGGGGHRGAAGFQSATPIPLERTGS